MISKYGECELQTVAESRLAVTMVLNHHTIPVKSTLRTGFFAIGPRIIFVQSVKQCGSLAQTKHFEGLFPHNAYLALCTYIRDRRERGADGVDLLLPLTISAGTSTGARGLSPPFFLLLCGRVFGSACLSSSRLSSNCCTGGDFQAYPHTHTHMAIGPPSLWTSLPRTFSLLGMKIVGESGDPSLLLLHSVSPWARERSKGEHYRASAFCPINTSAAPPQFICFPFPSSPFPFLHQRDIPLSLLSVAFVSTSP